MFNPSQLEILDGDHSHKYGLDMSLQLGPDDAEGPDIRLTANTCCTEPSILLCLLHVPRMFLSPSLFSSLPVIFFHEDEDANLFIDNGVWGESRSSATDARAISDDVFSPATPLLPNAHPLVKIEARIVKAEMGWIDECRSQYSQSKHPGRT